MEISDGDLVRLARDGDPVASRLLVERHQPMARARAAGLCLNPSDVDDIVQESFLQAFIALDRLRDPDRFAGWLGGIVLNVCRGLQRRAPVTLLADWPEPVHPAAGGPALGRGPRSRRRAARGGRGPARRAAARGRAALLRRPAARPDRRVGGRRPGQPAQGPPPAARVHHRAPSRSRPFREDAHDHRPHRTRRGPHRARPAAAHPGLHPRHRAG